MRAAVYTRYSSDRQSELSTQAQIRACREYAESNGIEIVHVYSDEAISGTEEKTDSREKYQALLEDAKKKVFDMILIHKHDRIARSLEEHVRLAAFLRKEQIPLVAVAQNFGDSIEGDLAKQIMWVLSDYYSKNLSKETMKGHRETALKALHNGGVPPFGYNVIDQHYVINELEAHYVRKMFDCVLNYKGYTALLLEMEKAGIVGKRGKPISRTSIHEILRNEKYTGTYLYSQSEEQSRELRRSKPNAIRIENAFPAIIDKKTFEEVQRIMDSRKQMGKKSEHLCSRLVYCSCGSKRHLRKSTRKGHTYFYYACYDKCGSTAVREEKVDQAALDYFSVLLSPQTQEKIYKYLRSYNGHQKDMIESFYAAVNKEIAAKKMEYENMMKNLSSGVVPKGIMQDMMGRMENLQKEIEALEKAEPPESYSTDTITDWLTSIKEAPTPKAIKLLIDRIEVTQNGKKIDLRVESTLKSILKMVAGEGLEPTTSGL